jgi:predicted metal-dependent hydrolase
MSYNFDYPIVRTKRKTLAIVVDSSSNVTIKAPLRVSLTQINQFVSQKQAWILKTIAKQQSKKPQLPTKLNWFANPDLESDSDLILDKKTMQLAKDKLQEYIVPNLQKYAQKMELYGLKINLQLKKYKAKWGSCSYTHARFGMVKKLPQKVILKFNTILAFVPPAVIDYVLVHELCHIFEPNHSTRFWALVAKFYPDHKTARKYLKEFNLRDL